MARSGLRWSLTELAQQSGVSRRTIARFEMGGRVSAQSLEALRMTLETAGAQFIESDQAIGVVLKGLAFVPFDTRTTPQTDDDDDGTSLSSDRKTS
jgi:transcriptional regulator with XRE-family HTH domain